MSRKVFGWTPETDPEWQASMSKKSRRWHPRTMSQEAREQSRRDKEEMYNAIVGNVPAATPSPYYMTYPTLMSSNQIRSMYLTMGDAVKPKELPTRQQVDTIRVFKLAKLVALDGAIRLQGVGSNAIYDVDAKAECHRSSMSLFSGFTLSFGETAEPKAHESPEVYCTCGFYGVPHKTAKQVETDYSTRRYVRVEAELFGRVVRHEHGYRAERQRVISVTVPRKCRTLGPSLPDNSISLFGSSGPPEVACSHAPTGMRIDGGLVVPTCDTHAPFGATPLTDVAKMLGVQIRWAE